MQHNKCTIDSNEHVIDYQQYWQYVNYLFYQYEKSYYDSFFD